MEGLDANENAKHIANDKLCDIYLTKINEARGQVHLSEIQDIRSIGINNVETISRESEMLSESYQSSVSNEEAIAVFSEKLVSALQLNDEDDENLYALKLKALSSSITHMDVNYANSEGIINLTVSFFQVYLELDEVAKMIDGDIVIQGTMFNKDYGPVLCVIDYQADLDESKRQTVRVAPWQMIISTSPEEDGHDSFMIPASIRADLLEAGTVSVEVFVEERSKIPYHDEIDDFDFSPLSYVRALMYMTRSILPNSYDDANNNNNSNVNRLESMKSDVDIDGVQNGSPSSDNHGDDMNYVVDDDNDENDELLLNIDTTAVSEGSVLIIQSLKIATDYDDLMGLQADGYEVCCEQITENGAIGDQEHMWKFHVCAMYGPPEEGGVEDVVWLRTPKSIGTLPVLKGYVVYHDVDLTEMEDDYSVFLAVKTGPNPKFTKLTLLQCSVDLESLLRSYLKAHNCLFRKAPTEICNMMHNICGLALKVPVSLRETNEIGGIKDFSDKMHMGKSGGKVRRIHHEDGEDDDDDFSRVTDDSSLDGEEVTEEDILSSLLENAESLKDEKNELLNMNQELQKRCMTIIQKERSLQIQNTTKGPVAPAKEGTAAEILHHLDAEQLAEKEKLFNDTLELIFESRTKLARQQGEFDQLALDLQTRLDDKEFKAGEIGSSFKEFKREILAKAVNSRTGKTISARLINQFEMIEQKREEDLERVRLKNISLRTTLRKLERALRAKEHLAEGLHMIDFEQLKIENQTLNEKIEERNEELAKLKRKKTVTVQVLTHVREKLRFIEKSNDTVRVELEEVENQMLEMRSVLTSTKRDRDHLKLDNKELRRQQGFATSDLLLVDFESRKGNLDTMKAEIRELKSKYNVLAKQAGVHVAAPTSAPAGGRTADIGPHSLLIGGR